MILQLLRAMANIVTYVLGMLATDHYFLARYARWDGWIV